MQKYTIPKLLGLAMLSMFLLVAISFLEVAVYSYFIESGHEMSFYEAHAEVSAPWISGIFGFLLFFLVVRFWKKKALPNLSKLALYYPVCYIILDLAILIAIGNIEWGSFILVFFLANGAKFLGSYAGLKFG